MEGLHEMRKDDAASFLSCGHTTPTPTARRSLEEDAHIQGPHHPILRRKSVGQHVPLPSTTSRGNINKLVNKVHAAPLD